MGKEKGTKELTALDSSLCGSFAGFVAAITTNPLDVAKTRIMLAERNDPMARVNFIYVARQIYHEGGLKGLYAGTTPRILLITLGGALFLGGYDILLRLIGDLSGNRHPGC